MARIDVYLRSIERFGATGAILTSGGAITLKFPAGDRNATQVVPHDQLVQMVREVAPPQALDAIDAGRPARFEYESQVRYTLSVTPRPNAWQCVIDGPSGAPQPVAAAPSQPVRRAQSQPVAATEDFGIERGQYDDGASSVAAPTASGSAFLDGLTHAARGQRASDIFLGTGAPPLVRANGTISAPSPGALDQETISRELGLVAPQEARATWSEHGTGTFTYGDGMGRVRVTLTRDHHGPGAALRLLVGEPPSLERVGLPREVMAWLDQRGVIVIAGASGSGKSTTMAALVKSLGEKGRRVVTFEEPIELVHPPNGFISQRSDDAVRVAMAEGADAIAIDRVVETQALVAAIAAGHLVLITVPSATAAHAIAHLTAGMAEHAKAVVEHGFLGAVAGVVQGGTRRFEVVGRSD
ncbi:MAG: ATPase, T2SS/T4P/T4SS family [Kofleriaceae bacterium]